MREGKASQDGLSLGLGFGLLRSARRGRQVRWNVFWFVVFICLYLFCLTRWH